MVNVEQFARREIGGLLSAAAAPPRVTAGQHTREAGTCRTILCRVVPEFDDPALRDTFVAERAPGGKWIRLQPSRLG
jgi:hypothetical protein